MTFDLPSVFVKRNPCAIIRDIFGKQDRMAKHIFNRGVTEHYPTLYIRENHTDWDDFKHSFEEIEPDRRFLCQRGIPFPIDGQKCEALLKMQDILTQLGVSRVGHAQNLQYKIQLSSDTLFTAHNLNASSSKSLSSVEA